MIDNAARRPISDETLMRFADGDLPPDAQESVAAEIGRNPDLAKRLEAFKFTREELAHAFASTLEVPPSLIGKVHAIHLTTQASGMRSRSLVAKSPLGRRSLRHEILAMAAAVAFLLAGAAGWLLRDGLHPNYAGLDTPLTLQHALEQTPSHEIARLADGRSIEVTSTFASLQKRWCREYKLLDAGRVRSLALACRADDGIWREEAAEAVPAASQRSQRAYVPAGSDQAGSLAAYRNRIFDRDVSAEVELRLIKGHWSRSH